MASKTNCTINGKDYYRIKRKIGKKLNSKGVWVDDYKPPSTVRIKPKQRLNSKPLWTIRKRVSLTRLYSSAK